MLPSETNPVHTRISSNNLKKKSLHTNYDELIFMKTRTREASPDNRGQTACA